MRLTNKELVLIQKYLKEELRYAIVVIDGKPNKGTVDAYRAFLETRGIRYPASAVFPSRLCDLHPDVVAYMNKDKVSIKSEEVIVPPVVAVTAEPDEENEPDTETKENTDIDDGETLDENSESEPSDDSEDEISEAFDDEDDEDYEAEGDDDLDNVDETDM